MTAPATQAHEDDVLGKAYDRKLMGRLLVFTSPYRGFMYGAFILLCIEGGVQVVGPLLTRRVIDVAVPARDMHVVVVCTALLLLALLTEFVTSYGQTWLTSLLGQRVMRDLRMEIFEHLQRLSVSYFDRNPAGRLITRVTSDVETLNELFTSGVVSGLGDLFTLVAISVAMLIMDWRLALASFLVIPFVVLVSGLFRKGVRDTYRDIRVRLARINSFLQERLTSMPISNRSRSTHSIFRRSSCSHRSRSRSSSLRERPASTRISSASARSRHFFSSCEDSSSRSRICPRSTTFSRPRWRARSASSLCSIPSRAFRIGLSASKC